MTILMIIMFSGWDGTYMGHRPIATYETRVLCENAKTKLETRPTYHKYLCVKEIK